MGNESLIADYYRCQAVILTPSNNWVSRPEAVAAWRRIRRYIGVHDGLDAHYTAIEDAINTTGHEYDVVDVLHSLEAVGDVLRELIDAERNAGTQMALFEL